ncbi:Ig-like domain-containing protein [Rhodococcus tukisamuensis]|uniref:Ig-like domain (Group 3) n=1 Tax=Rhodococcus tukisamuensis TaxID=168276 RepID=A0A1G7CB12_9NOCA|nr:Ig-like domain-containing protein [Rhodococcus tukisamuensis]SDE36572.1 Ig-like domain (group 3) [Rhodococcus tukisamuensis]
MTHENTRRVIGGLSAVAIAAGFAVTAGVGMAGAAPSSVSWADGNSNFTRTVSNTTPVEGEIVTTSMKFMRKALTVVEYVQAVKDFHPACMTYVDGSAKVDGSPRGLESQGADFVRVTGDWSVYPNIEPKSRTFEFSYKVGANCDRDVAMNTWTDYSGSLGSGSYPNKGTTVTVSKNVTTTALAAVPAGVQVGQAVPLTATVTGGAAGNNVEFFDGATKIGQGALDAAGVATLTWTPAERGAHSLSAKFGATAKAQGSQSAQQNIQVAQSDAVSSTTLAPITDAQVGRSSTLKATVSPAGAGGNVVFKDGAATLAEVPVGANGEAVYSWVPATPGAHAITATFSGRTGVTGSNTSANVTVAAQPAENSSSTTVLTVGENLKVGQASSVSAKVTPGNAGGSVTFKENGVVIGTANVDANGQASIAWTPAVAGQRSIAAEFSGVGTVNASADSVSVAVAEGNPGGENGGGTGSLGSLFGS